jgi:SAM-dependent methyltransferase
MQRVLEPELMLDESQVAAFTWARKDYGIQGFLELYQKHVNLTQGKIIDLGTGPAQYLLALEKIYPKLSITGYDGSKNMVKIAKSLIDESKSKIRIYHRSIDRIFDIADCVISTNTLHHLHDPTIFWNCIKRTTYQCLVFDLLRPESESQAKFIVDYYASEESELFKNDYYNSLLAAFSKEELLDQIKDTNLKYKIISGKCKFSKSIVIYGNL